MKINHNGSGAHFHCVYIEHSTVLDLFYTFVCHLYNSHERHLFIIANDTDMQRIEMDFT